MKQKLKALSQDKFIQHNILFFSGSILVAVINYLYHPIVSRFISVHDFGESQSFLSLYLEFGILLSALGTVVIHVTTNTPPEERIHYLKRLQTVSFWFMGIVIVISALSLPFLKSFFKFESYLPFIPIFIMLLINTAFIFRSSYLQGAQDFKAATTSSVISAIGKLFFTLILVLLGTAVFGILAGYMLASITSFWYVWNKTKIDFAAPTPSSHSTISVQEILRKELPYALLILCTLGFITFLYTGDILIVKRFFNTEDTGLYSGIATIARIVFFTTASVASVLLPHVKMNQSVTTNLKTLGKAIGITCILGLSVLALFFVFPQFIIIIMVGSRYLPYAHLLFLLGFTIFLIALVNLLFYYFVALRNYWIIAVSAIGALLIIWRIAYFHQTPRDIVIDFLYGVSAMLVLLSLLVFRQYVTRTQ